MNGAHRSPRSSRPQPTDTRIRSGVRCIWMTVLPVMRGGLGQITVLARLTCSSLLISVCLDPGIMGSGHRRRRVGFLLLLVMAGVVAAVVPLTPSTWPQAVRMALAVVGAIAAGAAGSYVSEWLAARRAMKVAEDAAEAEAEARRAALVATREVPSADVSVAALLRPEYGRWRLPDVWAN